MIRHRKPFPIWHKCVFRSAQHRADIVGVVIRGIKIGVITNARRQLQRDILLRVEGPAAQCSVITQRRCVGGEQMLDHFPRLAPGRPAQSQKPVQSAIREYTPTLKLRHLEMTKLLEHRQIQHELADGDPNTRPTL